MDLHLQWCSKRKGLLGCQIFMSNVCTFLDNHFSLLFRLLFSYCFLFQTDKQMSSRLKWTPEEEELLRSMGGSNLKNKWTHIAKLINDLMPAVQRTAKQCREKYNNHLIFGDRSYDANWSQGQDEILFNQYKEKGPRWKNISQSFPTKSQNTIKNRFYGNVRKIVRKLNKIGKEKISKSFKPIREKSIIRIIEPDCGLPELSESVIAQMRNLREKLLELIKVGMDEDEDQELGKIDYYVKLIREIHSFNCTCRFYRNFKPRSQRKMSKGNLNVKNNSTDVHNEDSCEIISEQENEESSQLDEIEGQLPDLNKNDKNPSSAPEQKKSQFPNPNPDSPKFSSASVPKAKPVQPFRPKKPQSDHFLLLVHYYVAEYCLAYDQECYELIARKNCL